MWKEKIAFYEEQMNDTIEKAKGVIYNIQEPYIEEEMEELGKMFEVNLSKAIGNEDQIQYHISKLLAPLIDSMYISLYLRHSIHIYIYIYPYFTYYYMHLAPLRSLSSYYPFKYSWLKYGQKK